MPLEVGPHIPGHPSGWLAFEWLPRDLQAQEDDLAARDYQLWGSDVGASGRGPRFVWRPAAPIERILLEQLGLRLPPTGLRTCVHMPGGIRRRYWTSLRDQYEKLMKGNPV